MGGWWRQVCDKLANEFFITGQLWFDFFSPRKLGGHGVFFTWAFLVTCVTVFAYMGGSYPYWQLKDRNSIQTEVYRQYTTDPRGMLYWFWTQEQSSFTFDFNFLLLWCVSRSSSNMDAYHVPCLKPDSQIM